MLVDTTSSYVGAHAQGNNHNHNNHHQRSPSAPYTMADNDDSSPDATTPSSSSLVDATMLRNALRLVHCIQKERGSSCAYYVDNAHFEQAMHEARTHSDISVRYFRHKDLPIASNLGKIRNLIATHEHKKKDEDEDSDDHAVIFHRIFVCFNTLISSVVHECILKQVVGEGRNTKKCRSTIRNRHKRGLSYDINDKLCSALLITPTTEAHKTTTGIGGTSTPRRSNHNPRLLVPVESGDFDSSNDSSSSQAPPPPPLAQAPNEDDPLGTSQSSKASDPSLRPTTTFEIVPTTEPKVQELLNLLHLFVQLKESAGVERAILSSLLALRLLGKTKNSNAGLLMNDLILEVENQRSLIAMLEQLPEGPHRNLVLELGQLSPGLKELQTIVLHDLESLQTAEYDAATIWNMITLYVDKLHSLELLIIEELECSLPVPIIAPSPFATTTTTSTTTSENKLAVNQALEQIFPPSNGFDLLAQIESMSAEALKQRVLEVLKAEESSPESSSLVATSEGGGEEKASSSQPAEPQDHHYSAAANLNEDMNKALENPLDCAASKEWEISIYEIKFSKRIGQGASATTYLATWTGQDVAVKVASITKFGLEGWRTEVAALQRLHHPNVIRLLGSIYHESPLTYCLVLEYCNAGDVATALRYPTPRNFFFHVALSIANAMTYLHSRNVIHRDLKPGNVLCDGNVASGNFTVKVTDFGVATEAAVTASGGAAAGPKSRNLTGETGTYRWMAPEVIRHEDYSSMADVYSFAIMLWQFLTHEEPFANVEATEAARLAALEGKRPPLPQKTPKAIADLIQVNWSNQPNTRWKFERVSETLKEIQTSITAEEKTWLETPHGHSMYVEEPAEEEEEPKGGNKRGGGGGKVGHHGHGPNNHRAGSLLSGFFGSHKKSGKR